jgi:hypothetical protein
MKIMVAENSKYRGLMMVELIVSFAVLGMIMIAFAISLDGFRRLNYYHFTKQRCVSAAQATLDSIAITGTPIDKADVVRLWPGINIKIEESDGTGQWKGFKLVTVSAHKNVRNKKISVRLSRYIPAKDIALSKADSVSVLQER